MLHRILKKIIPYKFRFKLKKWRRRINNSLKKGISKTSIEDMRKLLVDEFGILQGDNLIISSSFGNLNADFSPTELVRLLQEVVGEEGNLVMPFYPPGNSYEWAVSGQIFDMQTTRSSMGILTQVFSKMPNVYKSKHPTKAVVAWGKNAEEIVSDHENSKTPFYWSSPYGWLLKNHSKSLGLGLKNNPMFHACEDVLNELLPNIYSKTKYNLKIRDNNVIYNIQTYVHDPVLLSSLIKIGDYIETLKLKSYKKKKFGFTFCYCLNNQELFEKCKNEFKNNKYRFKS